MKICIFVMNERLSGNIEPIPVHAGEIWKKGVFTLKMKQYLLLNLVFSVRAVSYGPIFFLARGEAK